MKSTTALAMIAAVAAGRHTAEYKTFLPTANQEPPRISQKKRRLNARRANRK